MADAYIMRMTDKAQDDDTAYGGTITLNKSLSDTILGVKNGVDLKLANGITLTLNGVEVRTNAKISNVASASGITESGGEITGYQDVNTLVTITANA